ncbi:HET domain-containing protein [Microdochium nivale]|nr:HET domain-containing protein [Microdochium nivale]
MMMEWKSSNTPDPKTPAPGGFRQGGSQPQQARQGRRINQTGFPPPRLPADHPKYLLDLRLWKIRLFEACWEEQDSELRTRGYGSVSYAWGGWNDRNRRTAANSPNYPDWYPTFDIGTDSKGNALSWVFPIVNRIVNHVQDPSKEQFTILGVRDALQSLRTRFVWWDWACIPQNIRDTATEKHPLSDVKQDEMNKMRFVYPHSTCTIMWMHNVDWDRASPLKTALQTCAALLGDVNRPFNHQLEFGEPVSTVYAVVDALTDVHLAEDWFRSLWCFQEGVLCAHPGRRFWDHSGGIFCDARGRFLETNSYRRLGDIKDLISVASDIVDLVIDMLHANVENPLSPDADATDEQQQQRKQPSGPPSSWSFKEWCSDPAFEQPARGIVNSLMVTGLVGMVSYKPLSLLNARLGRYPSPRSSDMEIEVNSVIGALDVDVSKYLDEATAKAKEDKARITNTVPPQKRKDMEASIDAAVHPAVREGMLAELFRHYQWRMLLLATPRRSSTGSDGRAVAIAAPALLPSLWSELVKVPRHRPIVTTPFTALETFLHTRLADRFHPPRLRYEGDPLAPEVIDCVTYDEAAGLPLPRLEYLHEPKLLVLRHVIPEICADSGRKQPLHSPADSSDGKRYKVFDLKAYEHPLWTRCMFYGHTTTNGSFVPTFQLVSWAEREAAFGRDVVLLPLEYTDAGSSGSWQKKRRLRCVVLSDFAPGKAALFQEKGRDLDLETLGRAVFVGVVDLEGENDAENGIGLDVTNLELSRDVVIY